MNEQKLRKKWEKRAIASIDFTKSPMSKSDEVVRYVTNELMIAYLQGSRDGLKEAIKFQKENET